MSEEIPSPTSPQPTKKRRRESPLSSASPERIIKKEKQDREGGEGHAFADVDSDQRITFSSLPPDLLEKISEYLPAGEILRVASTAKMFLNFGHVSVEKDDQKLEKRQASDAVISVVKGSRAQLMALISQIDQEVGLTACQAKILLPADSKTTAFQKQKQRETYAEILSGRISLEQALEQIKYLEFSFFQAQENLSLMKAWSYDLLPWQKTVLQAGLPWLSLIYYPNDPSCNGFFTSEEMSSDSYTLLHAEVAHSLISKDNPYALPISLDQVKTSTVEALIAALSTPPEWLFLRFYHAVTFEHCAIARAILTINPQLLAQLSARDQAKLQLSFMLAAQHKNISMLRLLVNVINADLCQAWILGVPLDPNMLYRAAVARNFQIAHILLGALNPDQRQTALIAPLDSFDDSSTLGMAVILGRTETAHALLAVLTAEQRLATILDPQAIAIPGESLGESLLCGAVRRGHPEMVRILLTGLNKEQCKTAILTQQKGQSAYSMAKTNQAMMALMKQYLTPSAMDLDVSLTASSSQPSPVRFFTAPSAAAASTPATEPRPSGSVAQH